MFIYFIFKGNLIQIGAISTLITLVVIIMNYIQGQLADKNRKKMMRYGTFAYSFG
jgi:hypothetical protein